MLRGRDERVEGKKPWLRKGQPEDGRGMSHAARKEERRGEGRDWEPEKLSLKHHRIVELMLMHPMMPLREVAEEVGLTYQYVSRLTSSDTFKAELDEQRKVYRELLFSGVAEKIAGNAHAMLDLMRKRVEEGKVQNKDLVNMGDLMLRSLGYGSKVGPQGGGVGDVQRHEHLHVHVDPEQLRQARERIGIRPVAEKLSADKGAGGGLVEGGQGGTLVLEDLLG